MSNIVSSPPNGPRILFCLDYPLAIGNSVAQTEGYFRDFHKREVCHQGSALSLLLFNILMSDVPQLLDVKTYVHADDILSAAEVDIHSL